MWCIYYRVQSLQYNASTRKSAEDVLKAQQATVDTVNAQRLVLKGQILAGIQKNRSNATHVDSANILQGRLRSGHQETRRNVPTVPTSRQTRSKKTRKGLSSIDDSVWKIYLKRWSEEVSLSEKTHQTRKDDWYTPLICDQTDYSMADLKKLAYSSQKSKMLRVCENKWQAYLVAGKANPDKHRGYSVQRAISKEHMDNVKEAIVKAAATPRPKTKKEITEMVITAYQKTYMAKHKLKKWPKKNPPRASSYVLRTYVASALAGLKRRKVDPRSYNRHADESDLRNLFSNECMLEAVNRCDAIVWDLVTNTDASQFIVGNVEKDKNLYVWVPNDHEGAQIIKVMKKQSNQNPKRVHVIFTVTAAGACFPPVLLIRGTKLKLEDAPSDEPKYIVKTYEKRFSPNPHLPTATPGEIWIVPPGVSDKTIYKEYTDSIFIPNYTKIRESLVYLDKTVGGVQVPELKVPLGTPEAMDENSEADEDEDEEMATPSNTATRNTRSTSRTQNRPVSDPSSSSSSSSSSSKKRKKANSGDGAKVKKAKVAAAQDEEEEGEEDDEDARADEENEVWDGVEEEEEEMKSDEEERGKRASSANASKKRKTKKLNTAQRFVWQG